MQVPTEELPILEQLVTLRNRLTALKTHQREEFVRTSDVLDIYNQALKQVEKLNQAREQAQTDAPESSASSSKGTAAGGGGETELNRVDYTLNDVFQLVSLFFLSIGKGREAPATICQLATLKRLLDHLNESGVYTENDIVSFQARLAELKDIIDNTDDVPEALAKLLHRKYTGCERILKSLTDSLSVLDPDLVPLHQKLIQFRRQLAGLAARPKAAKAEAQAFLEDLRAIDAKRVDGKFVGADGTSIPHGQALCGGLLEENFDICQDILARQEDVAIPLKPIYDRLSEMRAQLERLLLTHRWTLRETDLYNFQVSLTEIDKMRVNGKFVDAEGKKPEGQLVLLYLLRRCYGLIYRLMASSEPISEELMPIANKLSTIKRCLTEIQKFGGPGYSSRDLYPYALALSQIEALRKDGKFLARDGVSVPEGQAIVTSNLSEAYEILQLLREEMEQVEDST